MSGSALPRRKKTVEPLPEARPYARTLFARLAHPFIVPAGPGVDVKAFCRRLFEALSRFGSTLELSPARVRELGVLTSLRPEHDRLQHGSKQFKPLLLGQSTVQVRQ